ncbi:hypothetical protein [Lentibacillus daqui]|uniref:hypothetical protein n=1 Tax=Lentibacillus daqui TaxID=2911514 RepID=UPI0022B19A43|nr:hypothetical protein [Lentibacillus daqui]
MGVIIDRVDEKTIGRPELQELATKLIGSLEKSIDQSAKLIGNKTKLIKCQ